MWVSSKEFAVINDFKYDTLQKAINRAIKQNKKICTLSSNILHFIKISGK